MSLEQALASVAEEAIPAVVGIIREIAQHPADAQPGVAARLLKAAAAESALLRTMQADLDAGLR